MYFHYSKANENLMNQKIDYTLIYSFHFFYKKHLNDNLVNENWYSWFIYRLNILTFVDQW